jgi:hypothetical protein
MTNQPSWVAKDKPVRARTRPALPVPSEVRVRTREAAPIRIERVWPNGSAVFQRSDKPRKPFCRDETQPGFLGRIVKEDKTYRVYRWSAKGYADLGVCAGFSEALVKLGGRT